jgi:NADH-quinone oxidoreductase subunit K
MHVVYPAVVAALLFSIGIYGVLARRNAILVLMSVELMLGGVNLNLVVFDMWLRDRLHGGQALALFTIVIAAAEVGLGLAIVLLVFRTHRTIDVDALHALREDRGPAAADRPAERGPAGGDSAEDESADNESAEGVSAEDEPAAAGAEAEPGAQ